MVNVQNGQEKNVFSLTANRGILLVLDFPTLRCIYRKGSTVKISPANLK